MEVCTEKVKRTWFSLHLASGYGVSPDGSDDVGQPLSHLLRQEIEWMTKVVVVVVVTWKHGSHRVWSQNENVKLELCPPPNSQTTVSAGCSRTVVCGVGPRWHCAVVNWRRAKVACWGFTGTLLPWVGLTPWTCSNADPSKKKHQTHFGAQIPLRLPYHAGMRTTDWASLFSSPECIELMHQPSNASWSARLLDLPEEGIMTSLCIKYFNWSINCDLWFTI